MTPIRLLFVSGVGGARADFVAGWFGLNSNFVNSYWNIDINTGLSVGEQGNARAVTQGKTPEQCVNEFGFTLSKSANLYWALAIHPWIQNNDILEENVNNGKISFIQIDTGGADHNKIYWEFLVKTFLTERRHINQYRSNERWVIDHQIQKTNITDNDRIETFLKLHQSKKSDKLESSILLPCKLHPINVKYTELFKPGGSRYLCDSVKIEMPNSAHNYWDSMIPFADSPDVITTWGREWHKKDYFLPNLVDTNQKI